MSYWKLAAVIAAGLLTMEPAHAIIVVGGRTTTGVLDNSGTNKNPAPFNLASFTGQHGSFLGTPIGPRHYVTATHIGGSPITFQYANGGSSVTSYSATRIDYLDDLAIWKIADTDPSFTHFIDIYTRNDEIGKQSISIGNGTLRGNPVNTPSTSDLAGWEWGSGSTLQSWGTNTVSSIVNLTVGSTQLGEFLALPFTRVLDSQGNPINPDSGIFSGGDSGGPTFILDPVDNVWKLAAINGYVSVVSQTPNGPAYLASLFDARGFYFGEDLITGSDPVPLESYATRISSRSEFILSYVAVPEPGSVALMAMAGLGAIGCIGWHYWRKKYLIHGAIVD